MNLTYIDLFAGCGGLSLGLQSAGWQGLFAIEKNKQAFSTLKYNLIDKNHFDWPSWLPIRNYSIDTLLINYKKELVALQGKVSLVAGGPPCQGFSTAGARVENDSRNKLIYSYIKFIELVKPEIVFFENVRGFTFSFNLKRKIKSYSEIVFKALTNLGYNVRAELIDFSNYGVPQKRNRYILVGRKDGKANIFFEELDSKKAAYLSTKGLSFPITLEDAISDLLQEHGDDKSPDSSNFRAGKYSKEKTTYQKLMRSGKKYSSLVADSHRFTNHKRETIDLFVKVLNKAERNKRVSDNLRKILGIKKRSITPLAPNQPCPVLTSHPDDYIHYSEPRILTVREYARIQSFPDWFEFKEKYTTGGKARKREVPRYTQVGNAIPPLFAEQVGITLT